MSTVTPEAASTTDQLVIQLFDHPDVDIVLRSQDSQDFQVLKIYIVNSSPVLGKIIQEALDSPSNANAEESLPVLQLPESGEILECLLTFVLPVTPRVPSTLEKIVELLSVAQKYQMEATLSHIRASIAQQNLLPTRLHSALLLYVLAQMYSLRPEALQAAQSILKYPMTIENFCKKLDIVPGDFLYALWKYHKRVRAILASDIAKFRRSGAHGTITGLRCAELSSSKTPLWLDQYMESIAMTAQCPHNLDFTELHIAMVQHIKYKAKKSSCKCASIPGQTIRRFWTALMSVIKGSLKKVIVVDMQSRLEC
jgi:hypothetical protein